jgi:hypothetical protein
LELARASKTKYIWTCCDNFLPSFDIFLFYTRAPLTVVCVTETYRMRGRPGCGLASVGKFCI